MSFINKNISILLKSNKIINQYKLIRNLCSSVENDKIKEKPVKSGFAEAFERHAAGPEKLPEDRPNETFAHLLKNSKFIDLGDPEGKIVSGKIFHVVENDLYIDFGWKFHCVCPRPTKNGSDYVRGAKVRLRIKTLELSTRFLGSEKDLTILEADCQLLGLISQTYLSKSIAEN